MGKLLQVRFGARLQPRCGLLPPGASFSPEKLEMLVLGPRRRMHTPDSLGLRFRYLNVKQ